MSIAEKLITIADNQQKVYDAGYAAGQANSTVNEQYIIEKTVTGAGALRLNDVSENKHDISVQITSDVYDLTNFGKNLIPYPFVQTTRTLNGVTFTDNGDGTITLNGTSTANATYLCNMVPYGLKEQARLSGTPVGGYDNGVSVNCSYRKEGETTTSYARDYGNGITIPAGAHKMLIYITVSSGYTFENVICSPQIEYGTTATTYESYRPSYRTLILTQSGENLLPHSYESQSSTTAGLTMTNNNDGTITFEGTPTGYAAFTFVKDFKLLPNTYYCFGGFENTYNVEPLIQLYDSNGTVIKTFTETSGMCHMPLTFNTIDYPTAVTALFSARRKNNNVPTSGTASPFVRAVTDADSYHINDDGTVTGVMGVAPEMNFIVNNKDVNITVSYHKSYGSQMEYDRFWDIFQNNGRVSNYTFAFAGVKWNQQVFNPKYDILISSGNAGNSMFYYSGITEIPVVIDARSVTAFTQPFYYASKLKTIKLLKTSDTTQYGANTFGGCSSLENITIEGSIAYSTGFPVSSKLTHDSLISILNALKDYSGSGSTYTLTLHADAKARLSDTEKAIATNKGWTIA